LRVIHLNTHLKLGDINLMGLNLNKIQKIGSTAVVARKVSTNNFFLPKEIKDNYQGSFVELRSNDIKFIQNDDTITKLVIRNVNNLNLQAEYTREEVLNAPKSKEQLDSKSGKGIYSLYVLNWK
jgi:hypothetical protein